MAQNDILLYTAATMNGYKPVIFLEEAGIDYDIDVIDFSKQDQFKPDFLKLCPNGKIPVIFDRPEQRAIFESGAILWHLAEKYKKFLPLESVGRSEAMQWMMFQIGHVGPMLGQAMYFQRAAIANGQEDPFAIQRYVTESQRLLTVIDQHLAGKEYFIGDYSIVDMMIYPWARAYPWAKLDIKGLDHLQNWFARLDARPAIQKALTIPKAQPQFWQQA